MIGDVKMADKKKFILAVPNFSDGRRKEVIESIVSELKGVEGVKLISYEPEHDFNRTVVTVIGEPQSLKEALLNMAAKSYELIDMQGRTVFITGGSRGIGRAIALKAAQK